MSDSVITTGTALVGTGAWFANQIFGPSAGAVGENLKVHLQNRLPTIFGRSAQLAEEKAITLGPIKPGLLTRMVVDASFSDDSEEITEWWANLFIEAGSEAFEANRQAVFSDIMAMLGPREVSVLTEFVGYFHQQVKLFPKSERRREMRAPSYKNVSSPTYSSGVL